MNSLLSDPWIAARIDEAVAPYVGVLPAEEVAWMREQLAETLATDEHAAQILRGARPREVDQAERSDAIPGRVTTRGPRTRASVGERDKAREDAERLREGTDLIGLVATRLARRLGRHVQLDDLKALGREALMSIVKSYDASRGKFRTYAILKLRWAMLDGIRRETHGRTAAARIQALVASERFGGALSAVPADNEPVFSEEGYKERLRVLLEGHAAALAVGLIASVGDMALVPDVADGPEESASRRQLAAVLRRAVRDLPERERALIERHYFEGEQFDLIARELGISKSWASRLHAQAIETLGKALCAFWSSPG